MTPNSFINDIYPPKYIHLISWLDELVENAPTQLESACNLVSFLFALEKDKNNDSILWDYIDEKIDYLNFYILAVELICNFKPQSDESKMWIAGACLDSEFKKYIRYQISKYKSARYKSFSLENDLIYDRHRNQIWGLIYGNDIYEKIKEKTFALSQEMPAFNEKHLILNNIKVHTKTKKNQQKFKRT